MGVSEMFRPGGRRPRVAARWVSSGRKALQEPCRLRNSPYIKRWKNISMLRRDLLRAWIATPLRSWLRGWELPRAGGAATEGPNAADVYRRAFDWAEGLRPEESERLRKASGHDVPGFGFLEVLAEGGVQAVAHTQELDGMEGALGDPLFHLD